MSLLKRIEQGQSSAPKEISLDVDGDGLLLEKAKKMKPGDKLVFFVTDPARELTEITASTWRNEINDALVNAKVTIELPNKFHPTKRNIIVNCSKIE